MWILAKYKYSEFILMSDDLKKVFGENIEIYRPLIKIFKLETNSAMKNLNRIMQAGKNFLIDRGDLSKEIEIEKALGVIDKVVPQEVVVEKKEVVVPSHGDDVDNDYAYQRQNFYNLVERGQDAIDGILELAKESEHPRAYEVAGNLIKQVADVTEKLGDLQEKMRKLKEVPDHGPKNVTNALFVGSTAELQKMLKGKSE